MDRVCKDCGKTLTDEPAMLIDNECFCFLHAKRAYPVALAQRGSEERALNVHYRDRVAGFKRHQKEHERLLSDWADRRFQYSLDNGFSGAPKWLLYTLGVIFIWAAHPGAGIVSVIVLWFVVTIMEEQFQEKRLRRFDEEFAEPKFTESAPSYRSLAPVTLQPHPTNNDQALLDVGYDRREILKRDGGRCQHCGRRFQDELVEVHHVTPVSKGGSDSKRNLVTLCLKCHLEEGWFGHVHKQRASFGLETRP